MLARLGGDEFAIILPDIPDPAIVGRIAENILEVLRAENEHSPTYSLVTASIGIAVCPGDATDSHALLSHADAALYRAKDEGRATYRFFEAAMGVEIHDRRLLEHDLRHAIARREIELIYQPQQDVKSGKVVGFEALLRWTHASRGDISPSIFIPIAEESGAIPNWRMGPAYGLYRGGSLEPSVGRCRQCFSNSTLQWRVFPTGP